MRNRLVCGGPATPVETINVGFGNFFVSRRAVAVVRFDSSPAKRLVDIATKENRLINATSGRRTRSILITDTNHVILSHLQPRSLAQKLAKGDMGEEDAGSPAPEE